MPNLPLKKLIQLSGRASKPSVSHSIIILGSNVPFSLRNQEPNSHIERKTNTRVEPFRLQLPTPFISVDRVSGSDIHDDAGYAG